MQRRRRAATAKLSRFLRVARGDEPADLVLRNAQVVNVFTGEIVRTEVALSGDRIAGVGSGYEGKGQLDLGGRFVCPGLIDAHVHIESSMVTPLQYARVVVPRGTTAVVADPHEIANVAGFRGIRYMLAASEGLPLTVNFTLPSCVPATSMATAGAALDATDLLVAAGWPRVVGLAETMNVPGAVLGLPDAVAKLEVFGRRRGAGVIDGHAPGLGGKWLQAYVGAGAGSDHEATSADEMLEKLRAGMIIFVREATGAKNVRALVPAITPYNSRRCAFCTDDRHPGDLIDEGHIDHLIRIATGEGLDPVTAIRMATLNAAEWFGLRDRGAIAPGRRADMVVFSNPRRFRAEMVLSGGELVAKDGEPMGIWPTPTTDDALIRDSVHIDWSALSFDIPAPVPSACDTLARVIGIVPDQIVTESLAERVPVVRGLAGSDPQRDILKLAVIERHQATGNVGLGFVRGLGLQRGALAGSVGHDAHNLIVAGCDDTSMRTAATTVAEIGGGLVACAGEDVLASVPLPIAGLMSDRSVEEVSSKMAALVEAARGLGSSLHDPFMTMGFLALEVIPALRLTDQGLVDVNRFELVPLWLE